MSKTISENPLIITMRAGVPVYSSNPSIPDRDSIAKRRQKQIGNDHKGLIIDGSSGEILGQGSALAYEWEEVDSERFVKLFLGGLQKAAGLSKAGLRIFEVVYNIMRGTPNTDRVELSFWDASQRIDGLNDRTYRRGVRELLDREILYRSPREGVFFVDIRCMFNGDRLLFVKGYHLNNGKKQQKKTIPAKVDDPQGSLPL